MADFRELALKTVTDTYHAYFVNKDFDNLMKKCESTAAVVGVDKPMWDYELIVINEQQQIEMYSDNTCMVMIKACIRDATYRMKGDRYFLGTFLCKLFGEEVRFLSVHISEDKGMLIQSGISQYSEEYYKRTLKYMYDVVFEYDSFKNSFSYDMVKYRELFQVDRHFVSMDQWFWNMCSECLHPDDTEYLDIFRNNDIGKRIRTDDCVVEECIRIRNKEKGYIWIKMVVVFIPNKARNNIEKVFVMFKDIDTQKRKEISFMHKARIDSLTELFNKSYTEEKINEYLNKSDVKRGAYVIFDIKGFKKINDTYGHIAGNDILVSVAKKIFNSVNENDIVGRIGGDQIAVFIKGCANKENAQKKIDEILSQMEYEYFEDDIATLITCNYGYAVYSLENMTSEELYNAAMRNLEANKSK